MERATEVEGQLPFYVQCLRRAFVARKKRNQAYSLRSFARDLEISSGSLSSILRRGRALPRSLAARIADCLQLSPKERAAFTESLATRRTWRQLKRFPTHDELLLEEARFQSIADWEHYAILSLMDADAFCSDTTWIATRLNIPEMQAETALENLRVAQLIERNPESGEWRKTFGRLVTTEDVLSRALQKSHLENFDLARAKLTELAPSVRDFSSVTLAFHPERLPAAKELIREFRRRFGELLEQGTKSEVYRLAIQFFPLTQLAPAASNSTTKGES